MILIFNDVIKLVNVSYETDEAGDTTQIKTSREVFAKVISIGMNEFYQAQAHGFKPELAFLLPDYRDYENEPFLIYNNIEYSVLRTFVKDEDLTLKIIVTRRINRGDIDDLT